VSEKEGTRMTEMVTFPVGGRTATGYLALPEQGQGPALLVLHAWWGLTDFFKAVCDRLGGEGFVALAPDLYHGKIATSLEEAERLSALDEDTASQDIIGAIAFLLKQPAMSGSTIGAVGFSLGGYWALLLKEPVTAMVTFYGLPAPESVTANAAFLGHFAEHDEFESVESVHQLETYLHGSGREASFYIYPGTQHWFFEQDRPDFYHPEAAQLAWERTISFLRRHLNR
jgi:carboxymethylenebutenolidase